MDVAVTIVLTVLILCVLAWRFTVSPFDELAKIRMAQEKRLAIAERQAVATEAIVVYVKTLADFFVPSPSAIVAHGG